MGCIWVRSRIENSRSGEERQGKVWSNKSEHSEHTYQRFRISFGFVFVSTFRFRINERRLRINKRRLRINERRFRISFGFVFVSTFRFRISFGFVFVSTFRFRINKRRFRFNVGYVSTSVPRTEYRGRGGGKRSPLSSFPVTRDGVTET